MTLAYVPSPPSNGFHLGPLFFHFYGLCIAVGILLAVTVARRRWQARGRDPAELERPAFWGVVFGFVGGRLGYLATHTGDYRGRWIHMLYIWEGGLALYGGLTLGILVGALVARRRGLPMFQALDAAIPGIPLAQAFGRWGNYFNQELFGTPTRLPWALKVSPDHVPDRFAGHTTFHPTFLYESLYDLVVFGALLWIDRRRRLRTGSLLLCYGILYGAGRFGLELLRTDTTFRLLGLSRNAWVSLLVVAAGVVWLVLRERGAGRAGLAPGPAGAAEEVSAPAGDAAEEDAAEEPSEAEPDAEQEAAGGGEPEPQGAAAGEGGGGSAAKRRRRWRG